ncbi:MAG: MATE family efflux transporter [Planctomycetaceae bacterium]|jgi:putative MATE family efflux protein|nr:MATE family efflux transporter [Planctomycetaceae bacterium]
MAAVVVKNMTVGNPAKLIILFTIPLLIGNLFQQFYNMADAFIVGRILGENALASVGCVASAMFLILGYAIGFTSGLTIVTAQRFGAGDAAGVRRSFAVGIVVCTVMTILMTAVCVPFTRSILECLQTPDGMIDGAYDYLSVILMGIGAAMLFNFVSGLLRAVGNSHTPLFFLGLACIINIILDYTFILVFHTGVGGAAVATVIAQIISGGLCIPYLMKKGSLFRLTRTDWRISWNDVWQHVRIAIPMGFQLSIIAIGALVVQYAINHLGDEIVVTANAAFAAAMRIDTIAILPLMSFGIATSTYTAQNYGAGKIKRIRDGIIQCVCISAAFAIFAGAVNIFYGYHLSSLFILNDPHATKLSHQFLTVNGSCYLILAMAFIFRYGLQGLGRNAVPTISGVMELVMRAFGALLLADYLGFIGICFANPLAWLGAAVPLGIAFIVTLRRLSKLSEHIVVSPREPQESSVPASHLSTQHPSHSPMVIVKNSESVG